MCENLDTAERRDCFNIPLQFSQTDRNNFYDLIGVYNREGATPFKMKYGRYRLESVKYTVVAGVDFETVCKTNTNGQETCYENRRDEYDSGRALLPEDLTFTVRQGAGCYLGSALVEMRFNDLIDFSLSQAFEPDLANLREGLSEAVESHVTRSC